MAAGRKEYELQMKLSAAIGSNFNSSFQAAMSTTKKLQTTLQSLNKVQSNVAAYKKTQEALAATKSKVQEYETKHNTLQSELAQTAAKEKELQKALKESENTTGKETEEYKQLQKQLQNTRNEKSKLKSQIKDNERATASANEKIKEQEQKLSELSQQLKATGVSTNKLTEENEKLEKVYQRVQKAQEDCARVNSAIEQNKAAISATKTELVKTVGVVATAGTAFYKGFIQPQAEFEAQMSNVKALISSSSKDLDGDMAKLTEIADKMGATTKFTATEAGQALEYMGMAGWKTEQMVSGLPGIMNLAAASGEELATVSDIVTDAMTAFGLAADGTTKGISNVNYFTDILAAASSNSNTNVALLGESFKYAAPLAGSFGFSVEDTALMLGLMANSGIKASQSGTSLRKIFTALTGDLKIAQKDGSEFVVATQNADGSMRDLKSIVDDVRKAFNGMSEADIIAMEKDLTATAQSLGIELNDENGELKTQAALYADVQDAMQSMTDAGKIQEAEAIASKTAMAGLLSIVNASTSDYNTLADAIYNAEGAAAKMAEIKQDTLIGDITLLASAWDGLARKIGKVFEPNLRTVIKRITEFLTKATEWAEANPELIMQIGKIAAGLAALKVGSLAGKLGFLEMKGGVLEVVKSFVGLRANMAESAAAAVTGGGKFASFGKSIAGYFGKVKTSIGGVGASINKLSGGTLSKVFGKIGSGIQNSVLKPLGSLGGKIKNVLGGAFGKVSGVFSTLGNKIAAGPLGKIGSVFSSLGKSIGTVVGGPLKSLGSLFGGLFGKAMPLIAIISALSIALLKLTGNDISSFIEPFKKAFEDLKPVLSDAMLKFQELGKDMLPLIMKAAQDIAPLLGQIVTAILPAIIELIKNLVPIISQLVKDLLPLILNIITTVLPLLTSIITDILPIITTLLQTLMPIISQLVQDILPIVVTVIETLLPPIKDLINAVLPILMSVLQALMPIIQMLADLFSNVLGAAIEGIKPVIEALTGVFKGVIDFITGVFSGDWSKAWDGIVSVFKNIIDGIVAIFKLPINLIIEGINFFIGGLNKLKIPDWVPGIGGKGINIPLIPKLEKGSNNTPDTFIAGDVNGKGGELITGAKGRKVFTAAQTTAIFENINRAKAINNSAEQNAPLPIQKATDISENVSKAKSIGDSTEQSATHPQTIIERVGGFIGAVKDAAAERLGIKEAAKPEPTPEPTTGGEINIEINYNPTIYVEGDKPNDLEEKLKENNEKLLQMFKEYLRQERENERRMSFA
ncbi:MAG: phage tail tape measure protein [Eubacterium sp.]|nr:phage tail tape measure protein [Eubacterium sp.]